MHFQLEQNGLAVDGTPYLKGQPIVNASLGKSDYIKLIVDKVGYDNKPSAVATLTALQHPYSVDFFRKLYEALK